MITLRQDIRARITNEYGITLVETLLSVVILVLILSIFLSMFVQSANRNRMSEDVIDATYLAQMQLENVYSKSLRSKNYEEAFAELSYRRTDEDDSWVYFTNTEHSSYSDYYSEIKIEKNDDDDLHLLVIEVYQKSDDSLQAMMQNILLWEQDEP